MHWLSHDEIVAFMWGVFTTCVLACLPLFFSGFFGEAGKDAWQLLKQTVFPKTPDPIEVERDFIPLGYAPGMCEWVRQMVLHDRESAGYTYYIHPDRHARCFRFTDHNRRVREYMMIRPH